MIELSSIVEVYNALPPIAQAGLASIATGFFEDIGKDVYGKMKAAFKPSEGRVEGLILAKVFQDFRESYLQETEDDATTLKIFGSFFKNEITVHELRKVFSGDKAEIDFDVLETNFIQKCEQHGRGWVPDFNFVQGISEVVNGIEALSERYPEFRSLFTQQKLSDIRDLLEKRGVERNLTLARRKYLQQLIEMHNKLRFTGIPDLKEKKDIPIPEVFVMLRAVEEKSPQDYSKLIELYDKDYFEMDFLKQVEDLGMAHQTEPIKFDQILRESQDTRFVILGAPGSGKSTLLKYLALAYAQNQFKNWLQLNTPYFPILIEIRNFEQKLKKTNQTDYNILDFLYDSMRGDYHGGLSHGFFEKYLNSGQALLLFDGLDEVGDESRRLEVKDKIHAFISALPKENLVVITSRIAGYSRTRFSVET